MTYALTHTMVKAHEHAAQRKAESVKNNRAGFVMCADDMTAEEFTDAVVEHAKASGMTVEQLEELERRIGRVAWQRGRV